ncbi:MAG: CUAEP/CCAEP-tail radical SAM (seleno)protein [Acetobacteraceae bacterium]
MRGAGAPVVLASTYDLGRQPFALASAAAWLEAGGIGVRLIDLAVDCVDEATLAAAPLIGLHLPMHTATRLARPFLERVRQLNPGAHLVAFGLYAPLNAGWPEELGVGSIIGGEFETPLLGLVQELRAGGGAAIRATALEKQKFLVPARSGLPELARYAHLVMPGGTRRTVGFTEASRGCKHLCRHCPIVPVYHGRFFVVGLETVLADIRALVGLGAEHISFGDPDFFNGTRHALRIVEAMHDEFPALTYDATIKVEHLLKNAAVLAVLAETGCLFITPAAESFDDRTLDALAKGHRGADIGTAARLCRDLGIAFSPTFVAFTPWTTIESYRDMLQAIADLGLVESVAPIQLAIRLLIPEGSALLELAEIRALIGPFDRDLLCYPWRHPDPAVDRLAEEVMAMVEAGAEAGRSRTEACLGIAAHLAALGVPLGAMPRAGQSLPQPAMSEPWYCCAEPTARQQSAY